MAAPTAGKTTLVAAVAAAAGAAAGAVAGAWWRDRSVRRAEEAERERLYPLRPFVEGAPVVAVDIDDTVAHFLPALASFHNEAYGTNLTLDDFHSYRFSEVWGGSEEESAAKVQAFFRSDHFHSLAAVEGARDVLERHKERFSYVVVTSRQHFLTTQTLLFLNRHFPGLFSAVLFGNHWASSGRKVTKAQLCREAGARVLIDDNIKYAREVAAEPGMQVVLFDWEQSYKYSVYDPESQPLPDNVAHVHSWAAVDAELSRYEAN